MNFIIFISNERFNHFQKNIINLIIIPVLIIDNKSTIKILIMKQKLKKIKQKN